MKIGIIGCGNIGSAIVNGLAAINDNQLYVSDISLSKLEKLQQKHQQIHICQSNIEITQQVDVIILAVKPWLVANIANEIKASINTQKQVVVSVAAGIDLQQLSCLFDDEKNQVLSLFRMIPNTAIAIRKGVLTIAHNTIATVGQIAIIKNLFTELGEVFVVEEQQLNAFMSLSSCGIAYAFRYIRAAVEGAVEMGIAPAIAQQVVAQTIIGATALLQANESHPESEIDKVTTPGGITIKGLNEMEANGFSNAVIKGLKASLLK